MFDPIEIPDAVQQEINELVAPVVRLATLTAVARDMKGKLFAYFGYSWLMPEQGEDEAHAMLKLQMELGLEEEHARLEEGTTTFRVLDPCRREF